MAQEPEDAAEVTKPSVAKVAVGQMCATSDLDKNYETCAALARDAAAQGCKLLCLPECFAYIGIAGTDALAVMVGRRCKLLGG